MRYALLSLAVVMTACGGTSGTDSTEIRNFGNTAQLVSAAATDYGTRAAVMTSVASCTGAQDAYDGQARPLVGRMQSMGPSMDALMGSMNHMADEDMACSAGAMMAELDRHRSAACLSSADMAPNVTEAEQHVARMNQWTTHELGRSHDMASMMGSSGMMGGSGGSGTTTGHCVHGADGSYTFQP
jgi:hypothetical protein